MIFCQVTERPIVVSGRQLDSAIVGRFSALAAAELAAAVSRFNSIVTNGPLPKPSRTIGRTSEAEASSLLRAVHSALKTGSRAIVRAKAKAAGVRASKLLPLLIKAAAYDALHDRSSVDVALGRHALDVADGLRSVLLIASAARMLGWMAGWPEDSPFFARWVQVAKTTAFRQAVTRIKPTSLSEIANNMHEFDGMRISVEGRVGSITIIHRGQKSISSTTLTDASGAQIRIGLPYIKIDAGGLVPGTFARITGRYASRHEDFDSPVLIPERRNLTDEAGASWLAWLALEMQPFHWSVPHNLSMEWTWSPGGEGPGNPLKYRIWASNERRRIHVG